MAWQLESGRIRSKQTVDQHQHCAVRIVIFSDEASLVEMEGDMAGMVSDEARDD